MLKIKRVYEPPAPTDGYRVLVDRLWPRGLTREDAAIDAWLKQLAPSTDLRRWLGSNNNAWPEFAQKYRDELTSPDLAPILADLRTRSRRSSVTLLYAKRDTTRNNAVVLLEVLGK